MGEKITQTMAVEVWNLTTPAAMFECLEELFERGYRGNVGAFWVPAPIIEALNEEGNSIPAPPGPPTAHWSIEINADDKPSLGALIGQVVVLFGGALEAMEAENYASRFNSGEGSDSP